MSALQAARHDAPDRRGRPDRDQPALLPVAGDRAVSGQLPGLAPGAATFTVGDGSVTFEVLGTPAPKGSGRAMMFGGKARFIASGSSANQKRLKSWDTALREAAREAIGEVTSPPFRDRALSITIEFRLTRPSGHYSKKTGEVLASAPPFPAVKPDLSKLLRATEDTLIGIVFDDDSRIVDAVLRKRYATPGNEGAQIIVRPMS